MRRITIALGLLTCLVFALDAKDSGVSMKIEAEKTEGKITTLATGQCFAIDSDVVATCLHTLEGKTDFFVIWDKKRRPAKLIKSLVLYDLAILRVKDAGFYVPTPKTLRADGQTIMVFELEHSISSGESGRAVMSGSKVVGMVKANVVRGKLRKAECLSIGAILKAYRD